MDIRIRAAGSSDRGRARRTNEDAFGFDLDRGLFIVCDGVGGRAAGEVASRSAVDCVLSRFPHSIEDFNDAGFELQRAIHVANRSIRAAQREEAYAGMCTTIVTAHFDGSRMWIAHIGDSRAYLLRRESLHRLTDDDSQLVQILRRDPLRLSSADAASLDSTLTQALGASDVVVPTVTMVQVQLGDCFLLATDGICKALSNSDMLSLLLASATPEQACQHLIHAADDSGGFDNATCIVVTID
ncbi:PP2C family protein-serine/threonine phosphatase [Silvibacterium dinghuense]|uniref:Serine/threonine-protein phosphatase n=1 Tax=Silvibacterium dinghuense TaxID=1560006 RepID=A0A4Q1SJ33_9BACT|nr:protein phosphatase 2C domain-containing protein [Silvibacterium dinghuense]RXS97433.1 serine/threonine-protein phosphatase [Silvibacterium dinghuense]GGG98988.1 serine/threonine phosphatase [Silvibacterium dinghuense]